MPATHALMELLGEVALLLWGVHMVRSGVMRAFGGDLRRLLGRALRNRLAACLAGTGVTLALQSSTATAFMTTSFLGGGLIELVPALAVMLGANVGTALVAWALSFDITVVYPVLIFAGLVVFRTGTRTRSRNLGRITIGLGFVLLSLHLLVQTIVPTGVSPEAKELIAALTREPLPVLAAAALIAWAMHSSVAAILVIASLAGAGLVTPYAALVMVLGANLGSALNPLLAAASGERSALRLPVGNIANRIVGCILVLPLLPALAGHPLVAGQDPAWLAVTFHLVFNLALAALSLPALSLQARLLERVLPDRPVPEDAGSARYLDPGSLATPRVALANAAREAFRMADTVEEMLRGSRELLRRDDYRLLDELRRKDDVLDRLHGALKRFLSELSQRELGGEECSRLAHVQTVALNLEHAGDIIDKGVLDLAAKRMRRRLCLTEQQVEEAEAMHDHLLAQLRLAVAVFMGEDLQSALRLVEGKERFRDLERAAAENEFAHTPDMGLQAETSSLHLDAVRDLKRIDAHFAAIAHPLLERNNLLRPSRLIRLPRAGKAGQA
ncbi:Na/Pi cotransporter family protein [Skermanella rosea]|uniref:Na/Pi cotransporter family protein n=1 Tax=Skermanella rosea TaxID=1817965 RepID=UPI0019336308|nr:Na/Pi cotransporter family protein [Skermanella rosea]UEM06269.1 Na/Pi cotransporter family protein [Skermanella rosea]